MFLPMFIGPRYSNLAAVSSLTKGSTSSGTTSVTTRRGGHATLFGAYTNSYLSGITTPAGLYASQTAGVLNVPRHTRLDVGGVRATGESNGLAISLDGATWYTFTWSAGEAFGDTTLPANYYYDLAGGGGDPFLFYSMSDGTVKDVLIALVP